MRILNGTVRCTIFLGQQCKELKPHVTWPVTTPASATNSNLPFRSLPNCKYYIPFRGVLTLWMHVDTTYEILKYEVIKRHTNWARETVCLDTRAANPIALDSPSQPNLTVHHCTLACTSGCWCNIYLKYIKRGIISFRFHPCTVVVIW